MGTDIDQEAFQEADYAQFERRLQECLATLGRLLARPGFGVGPVTLGAELELFLVDAAARPLLGNQAVRARTGDRRVTLELDRFNLELNATPTLLAGRPFTALGEELRLLLDRVAAAAAEHGGRVALVGILPTLRRTDLQPGVMTELPRYRALDRGLRRLRQAPFHIRINGADPLGAAQRRRRPGGGQHLLPGPPAGRPGRLCPHLQRRPAGHRAGAGGGRQLAHLPWPPAMGGDPHRPVQAVHRRPRRPRAPPSAGPGGVRDRLAAGGAAGPVRRGSAPA